MAVKEETFKFLNVYTPEKVIAGAYYALRLIRHRGQISDLAEGLFVDDIKSEPTRDERQLASAIVKEIENIEGVSILKFSEGKAGEYSLKLSKLIQERANVAYGRNKEKGKELLAQIRATY